MKNKMLKMGIVSIVLLASLKARSQSIKDFILPSQSNYNKSSYYSVGMNGERVGMSSDVYYTDKGNNVYELTKGVFMDGKLMSGLTTTIQITPTEVKMIKKGSRNQAYIQPLTILKLPKIGQTIKWSIPGESGDKPTMFTATLISIMFDGEKRPCIKLIEHPLNLRSKMIHYYIKGIGLTDTDMISENGSIRGFEKFNGLSYGDTDR